MKKNDIIKTLQSGICEITYIDSHSVEGSIIGTLSQTHLPDDIDTMDISDEPHSFVVFNVNTENWETISAHCVIDIEQLTGEGAVNNEKKLSASNDYLSGLFEGLEEISDEDFYESEGVTQ